MATTEDRIGARVAGKKAMTRSLVVRVSDDLWDKLQKLTVKVRDKTGMKATVSDVARAVLEEATETQKVPVPSLSFPDFNLDEAERMLDEGRSPYVVAQHFGMSVGTLRRYRKNRIGRTNDQG